VSRFEMLNSTESSVSDTPAYKIVGIRGITNVSSELT
jgi:hypothetical protein